MLSKRNILITIITINILIIYNQREYLIDQFKSFYDTLREKYEISKRNKKIDKILNYLNGIHLNTSDPVLNAHNQSSVAEIRMLLEEFRSQSS